MAAVLSQVQNIATGKAPALLCGISPKNLLWYGFMGELFQHQIHGHEMSVGLLETFSFVRSQQQRAWQ
jgi:hypothetical protein